MTKRLNNGTEYLILLGLNNGTVWHNLCFILLGLNNGTVWHNLYLILLGLNKKCNCIKQPIFNFVRTK